MFKKGLILGLAALALANASVPLAGDVSNIHLTDAERAKLDNTKETMSFQTEVARMMDIIINSLYTQRDVFLRELISNASDALEKARYLAVSDNEYLKEKSDLDIRVEYDDEAKTLTITDSGVGMSRQDLINNLGTLAKSGTTNFLEAMAGGSDLSLIGQFGVGFYSSYLVADRVTVVSKKNDDDQYIWESSADAKFSVAKDPRGNTLGRGTQIILHLKEDATEYMNESKLKELVSRYSQFISFPIQLKETITSSEEVDDIDSPVDEETSELKKKTIEKKELVWTHVNTQKAIWQRSKDECTQAEYNEFYKTITKDSNDPLAQTHFNAEGDVEFKSLLYIPSKAPSDMFEQYYNKSSQIKLYVRRVLVSDGLEDILPRYLHFIKGVVDSDDLPLNVSREQLQQHKVMNTISKSLVRKVLDLITKLSKDSIKEKEARKIKDVTDKNEDDEEKSEDKKEKKPEETTFDKFYKEFNKSIKMGCYEDDSNRSKIVKLIRYNTYKNMKEPVTLDQYIENMAAGQEGIYYLAGESLSLLRKSPHMQAFIKKGIDVLFLVDSMDEPCLQKANEYSGKKFISIQKGDIKLNDSDDEKKRFEKLKVMYEPLTKFLSDHFKSKASKVDLSSRLVDHPLTVVASPYGYSSQMEKMMKSQAFTDLEQVKFLMNLRNIEINPNHPIMIELLEKIKTNGAENVDKDTIKLIDILFQTATIAAGFDPQDPTELANKVYSLITKNLGRDPTAPIVDVDVSSVEDATSASNDEEVKADEKLDDDEDIEALLNHDEL